MIDTLISPSRLLDYAFCPRYHQLRQDGWVTKCVTPKDEAALLSTGVHAGLAAVENGWSEQAIQNAVLDAIADLHLSWMNGGRIVQEPPVQQAMSILAQYRSKPRLPEKWEIVATELSLAHDGTTTPDVIAYEPSLTYFPVDYKLKARLDRKWLSKEIEKYRYDWKQLVYSYLLGASQHVIVLIIVEPKFEVVVQPYPVSEASMREVEVQLKRYTWEVDALSQVEGVTPSRLDTNLTHRTEYGACDFMEPCLEGWLDDEARMRVQFTQIERVR